MKNPDSRIFVQQIKFVLLTSVFALPFLMPVSVQAQGADDEAIEEVTAYGVRRSLDNAAEIKRDSNAIVDAITAEDIGLFSDNNIGEALQRVPGVQLERSEGEGFRISIRGLGPRFVRTTLNGRTALSSPGGEGGSDARGFSFNIIPSEVITKATVHKSSQAIDTEGGIGGVVNLETTRPLDFAIDQKQDFYIGGSARGTFNDLEDKNSARGSLFLNKAVNDRFGVFFATSIDRSDRVQDSSESQDMDVVSVDDLQPGTLMNGVPLAEELNFDPALFDGIRNIRRDRSRDRNTYTGGLQWQPTDQLQVYIDWTHMDEEESREDYRSWLRAEDALDRLSDNDSPTIISDFTIVTEDADEFSDGSITAFNFQNYTEDRARQFVDIANLLIDAETDVDIGGINLEWSNDDWTVSTDFGYASQTREFLQRRVAGDLDFSDQNDPARFPLEGLGPDEDAGINGFFDITSGVPIVHFEDTSGVPFDVNDLTDINFDQDRQSYIVEDNSETAFRLDFENELLDRDDGDLVSFFDTINFGIAYRERDGFRNELRTEGNAGTRNTGDLADIGMAQYGVKTVTGFMEDIDVPGFNHSFVTPDLRGWIAADPAGTFAQDPALGVQRQDVLYEVNENITSAYFQASFASDGAIPYRGNIGIRYADTEQSSFGYIGVQEGADFFPLDEDNPASTSERTYDDWLPSANIAFDFTDTMVFRLAASKTITRPDPVDMRVGWDLDKDIEDAWDGDDNDQRGSSGNPDLDAYRTDNYDMSLEWYPEAGGAYALGLFYKKLDGFIADGVEFVDVDLSVYDPSFGVVTYEIQRPVNTDGGDIKGAEFALHTPFDVFTDGFFGNFGVNASVTYVDAELDAVRGSGRLVELRGTSEWSGNIVAYYEGGPLGVRLAYNTRNDFLHQEAVSSNDFDEYTIGKEYVTLNVDYKINDNWRIRLTGNNLTDSQRYREWGGASRQYFSDQRDDGRTMVLEIRGRM